VSESRNAMGVCATRGMLRRREVSYVRSGDKRRDVIDGLRNPRRRADVGVIGDTIVAVGDLREQAALRQIEAQGCIVSPGFVDIHSHSDRTLLVNHEQKARSGRGDH